MNEKVPWPGGLNNGITVLVFPGVLDLCGLMILNCRGQQNKAIKRELGCLDWAVHELLI